MIVTKTRVPRSMPAPETVYVVTLTQPEAMRLAYGPLSSYDATEIGETANGLVTGLLEAIAAPSCFVPTREIVEDWHADPVPVSPLQEIARELSFTGSDYQSWTDVDLMEVDE